MKTVYLFGDSIGLGIVTDENGRYHISKNSWVSILEANHYSINNYSCIGYTTKNGIEKLRKAETATGNICLLEFGGNDCDLNWNEVANTPSVYHQAKIEPEAFAENLRLLINESRDKGLTPVLLSPIPILAERYFKWIAQKVEADAVLSYLVDIEHIYRQQESYANIVRYEAQKAECMFVDIRQFFLQQHDLPSLICCDGIHINEQGHKLYASIMNEVLSDIVIDGV